MISATLAGAADLCSVGGTVVNEDGQPLGGLVEQGVKLGVEDDAGGVAVDPLDLERSPVDPQSLAPRFATIYGPGARVNSAEAQPAGFAGRANA